MVGYLMYNTIVLKLRAGVFWHPMKDKFNLSVI